MDSDPSVRDSAQFEALDEQRASPAMIPFCNAAIKSSCWMTPPRAVLITYAVGFIFF